MEGQPPLRSILDAFEDGVCLLDQAGTVYCMNRAAEEMTGYSQQELLGGPFLPNIEIALGGFGPGRAGDGSSQPAAGAWNRLRLHRKDGRDIDVMCAASSLGATGEQATLVRFRPIEWEGVRHPSREDTKARLRAVFDNLSDGLILFDEASKIDLFSSGAETLFGYKEDDVLGQNIEMLLSTRDKQTFDATLASFRETGAKRVIGVERDVSGQRKDGGVFPMYLSIGETYLDGRRLFACVIHDLTALKRAEKHRAMLSAAIEQSPVAVLISDTHGCIEYVNGSFSLLTGYAPNELIGQNPRILRSSLTTREQYRRLWDTIRSGHEWRGEIQDRKKNGELYWASQTITPLRGADDETTHYLAIQHDITLQKRGKEALAESEERFRQVADMAGDWLWEQDPQGHYTYSSAAVQNIIGFKPEEIIGKNYLDLLVENPHEYWSTAVPDIPGGAGQPFYRLVNKYNHKNGSEIYTESTGSPIFDHEGILIKWRGVDHDITARKTFEDALRLRERAIESVPIGVAIADAQTPGFPSIYVNPALCRMTGYTRGELLGKSMRILQGPETDPAALKEIHEALAEGKGCEVTLKNYRKGGAAFWNELLISPVVDDSGILTHFVGVQTDVTERRRADENRHELEIARNIQLSLLPSASLHLPGVELAGVCAPSRHVGGDYFDFFQSGEAVDAVIADVSGHSVEATLVMTEVRSILRAEARKAGLISLGPAQVLRDLNELLHDDLDKAELFITMFYLKFHPPTRILTYANAGHGSALLLRSNEQDCALLRSEGPALGVERRADFEEKSAELSCGDELLLCTDGVTKAENPKGEFFGVDRLCASFVAQRNLASEPLVKKLLDEARVFCGGAPLRDDASMVIMQVRPSSPL